MKFAKGCSFLKMNWSKTIDILGKKHFGAHTTTSCFLVWPRPTRNTIWQDPIINLCQESSEEVLQETGMRQHFSCASLCPKKLLQATENWLVSQDILVVNSVFQWKFGTLTKGFPCLRKNIFPQKKKYYFINLLTELPNPSSSMRARCCRASWEAPTIRRPRGHFITKMALCLIPLSRRELCRASFSPADQPSHRIR